MKNRPGVGFGNSTHSWLVARSLRLGASDHAESAEEEEERPQRGNARVGLFLVVSLVSLLPLWSLRSLPRRGDARGTRPAPTPLLTDYA